MLSWPLSPAKELCQRERATLYNNPNFQTVAAKTLRRNICYLLFELLRMFVQPSQSFEKERLSWCLLPCCRLQDGLWKF